jgi:hypothetical protein
MKMSTTHLGLLAIVLIAGIWLFMQGGTIVEAQPTAQSYAPPSLTVAPVATQPASVLPNLTAALSSLNSSVANVVMPAVDSAELMPVSSMARVAESVHETGLVFRQATITGADGNAVEIQSWQGDGIMVGTVDHPIKCEWVADGWTYTGPAEHASFVAQNAIMVSSMRDLCESNGAYGEPR